MSSLPTVVFACDCVQCPELGTLSLFPGSLTAHFISMDRYPSSAHLANFQVQRAMCPALTVSWLVCAAILNKVRLPTTFADYCIVAYGTGRVGRYGYLYA